VGFLGFFGWFFFGWVFYCQLWVQAFHTAACSSSTASSPYLPVIEHVSFLFDLAGQAFNIQVGFLIIFILFL
jgi:hypothetical protein